ncbi:Methyltransferase type 12 [Methanococcus vannielii SB]|jgi:ubiquinone/menaquinone biosynthesis C-methylase UbiE|uniref:Methyltransferase type 12 n=1 Tax=Methanococcus vannielii (strain ATCC 35089 / DSM 1224 / JCM 13029 / OCM 148 / SB) TaxID=406327 RepID=A6UR00_METVS|nr:class I SAM-dependent methyltransferase [Methanococcus vannielii]ABR54922.1 Methyltransferase type 12 [Methanococcus vannielii SB]
MVLSEIYGKETGVSMNMISEGELLKHSKTGIIEVNGIKKKVESLNYTVEYINNELIGIFFRQGLKFGIFKAIDDNRPKLDTVENILPYPNKDIINKYVKTALALKMLFLTDDGFLELNPSFKYSSIYPDHEKLISDHFSNYDFISSLVQYALIGYEHPEVVLNFKKDADIWDIMLNTNYMKTCRDVISEYLDLKDGDSVLEVGCGSRAPQYYASKLSPNGYYMGVDVSKKLIKIAEGRLKRNGLDCASLKPLDFCETISKYTYDYVICAHTLSYTDSKNLFLKKMMDSLKKGGKLVIMEEFFTENPAVNTPLFEFYKGLNKYFKGYNSRKDILNQLEILGYGYNYELLGNNCIVIERI